MLIVYDYDSNSILAAPMPRRTGPCILHAYQYLHSRLIAAGLRPQLQRLDNEASEILKDFMVDQGIDFQLVPPGSHRRNAAERAIRTFKNHFIAGLASVDKHFPLHLWDRLVPQAEATLNMLRGSRVNPKLSAYCQLNGHFDFNRTPMAPPGIRVLAHVKPALRTTWSPHAEDGWYIGPAMDSYRCYNIWMWETRAVRICDTLSWFPTKNIMPLASSTDLIVAGLHDIRHALLHPSAGSPLAPLTDSHHAALQQLTDVLTTVTPPTTAPTSTQLVALPQSNIPPPLRVALPELAPPNAPETRVVKFQHLPTPTSGPTYDNSTGSAGARRRKDARKRPKPRPLTASNECHPNKTKKSALRPSLKSKIKIEPSTNPHGTRSTTAPLRHIASLAQQIIISSATAPSPLLPAASSHYFPHHALLGHAINPDTGKIAEFKELQRCSEGDLWNESNAEEIGRLTQGYKNVKGTNTLFFIKFADMPPNRKATYLRIVAAFRPEKEQPRRIRWTVGGDRIEYPYAVSTKTADLTTAKLLLNSVVSTPNAKFMSNDIKDFYLDTTMERYEYMRIPISALPPAIIEQYKLAGLVHNGFVYAEIRKGMYGLPQAGRLAYDQLVTKLSVHGYRPTTNTPGLWRHDTLDIVFCLVVDDFGVRYTRQQDAEHLITALETCGYKITTDWEGTRYVGLTLQWDYAARTLDISMPGYIERALQRFQHPTPQIPENSPHPWQKPVYGAKTQYAPPPDMSTSIGPKETLRLQEILGTLLYYARALDSTLLTAISELGTEQSRGTAATMVKVTQLLNYCATNPEATIRYTASDMVLHIESDASYLSVTKARSRAAGFFYLGSTKPTPTPKPNGAIHILCHVMREVLSSAAEAELGALFHNGKEASPLRTALADMGHPQPATVIITDNSTAAGIANDTVKQKRSKAMDMRFYWIRDRVRQGQFLIHWRPGKLNLADYHSKHHPASHHTAIRSTYLYSPTAPTRNYFECLADESDALPLASSAFLCTNLSSPKSPGEGVLIPGYPDVPEPFYPLDSSSNSGQPTDCGSISTYSATPHNLM
jgi:hypothetical protein